MNYNRQACKGGSRGLNEPPLKTRPRLTSWLPFTQLSIRLVIESEHSVQFLLTQLTGFSLKPCNVLSKFQNA